MIIRYLDPWGWLHVGSSLSQGQVPKLVPHPYQTDPKGTLMALIQRTTHTQKESSVHPQPITERTLKQTEPEPMRLPDRYPAETLAQQPLVTRNPYPKSYTIHPEPEALSSNLKHQPNTSPKPANPSPKSQQINRNCKLTHYRRLERLTLTSFWVSENLSAQLPKC